MALVDPKGLLPLTPVVLHILLTLADGERHGYAIAQEVEETTDGQIRMGPGTLYGSIQRMLNASLIEETPQRRRPADDDERRRYYRITRWETRARVGAPAALARRATRPHKAPPARSRGCLDEPPVSARAKLPPRYADLSAFVPSTFGEDMIAFAKSALPTRGAVAAAVAGEFFALAADMVRSAPAQWIAAVQPSARRRLPRRSVR